MLVLRRHKDEAIMVGDDIKIHIVDIGNNNVKIGIEAPKEIGVHRQEVYLKIKGECEPLFLLLNPFAGFIGNSPCFWRKGGSGYTQWIDDAERFTKADADKEIRTTLGTHNFRAVSVELAERIAKRTIDIDDLRKAVEAEGE